MSVPGGTGFIVAMEYRGPALGAGAGKLRILVCEHAYDLETGTLAGHSTERQPRVGFPDCQRGWNSPPRTARCPYCDTIVQGVIRHLIAATISSLTGRQSEPRPTGHHTTPPDPRV